VAAESPRLFRYLRHNLPTPADAEDALSETMMAAVRALPSFDGKVPTTSFLYAIAYRKVADFWRKRSATVELSETLPAATIGDVSIEFMDALDTLPEQLRQALLLRYHVGLSVSEVAEVMDRSYKGAESLLSRARTQLREALRRVGIEHG
jgi:RNA polymerase sigma-70 factor (ECF subfamily)